MREAGCVLKQLEEDCRRNPAHMLRLAAEPSRVLQAASC